ncbi:hypothetical protein VE01_02349 [Pseudogymnoascus verrucosus]|uniref:Cardiolipin synthase n=1 Tax=Pseudogymnoascus verrucosus TaxID=342668 RepID=A0A1B8GTE6_9PEZI|nr:uncharacterized protein VE01_02349 [Pseudogymnoascus verrucosus]OBT99106.1 hypothetical protein VE01_02349 [Pseudogymnoascus verrucosus]
MATLQLLRQPNRQHVALFQAVRSSSTPTSLLLKPQSVASRFSRQTRANLWTCSSISSRTPSVTSLKLSNGSFTPRLGLYRNYSSEPEKKPQTSESNDPSPKGLKPLKSNVVKALAQLTPHENIYTIPNFLTLTRLIAAPIVGYLVLNDAHAWALGLFAYAGITDLVDGWIARKWNLQTVVGTIIDPLADKILMTVLTVTLAMQGMLPVWLAFIILGRDVGLGISAIYYRWISLPPPKTFTRYWDFSLPSAEVRPTTISKYNTALQLGLIGATTAMPLIPFELGATMTGFQYLVAATTIWSGASYVYSKDAVKILSQKKDEKKDETKEDTKK